MAKKNLQLEIISVSQPAFTKTARGGYHSIEVAYKNNGKIEGKKFVDFNNKEIFEALQKLQSGQTVYVVTEKGDGEQFWQWTSVTTEAPANAAEDSSGGTSAPAAPSGGSKPGTGRVVGNNYETPEERALRRAFEQVKHRQIGRQGCINSAVAILTHNNPKGAVSLDTVLDTAAKLEAFVFSAPAKAGAFDDMKDDIPF